MSDDDSAADGPSLSPSRIASLAARAKLVGKSAVAPTIQTLLRDEVVRLLREHDPEELERYMDVQYSLVHNELPEGYQSALATIGPTFSDQIQQIVTPQQIQAWLEHPEEWMDVEENPERVADVREVARLIRTHPDGQQYLQAECLSMYDICGILD